MSRFYISNSVSKVPTYSTLEEAINDASKFVQRSGSEQYIVKVMVKVSPGSQSRQLPPVQVTLED